MEEIRYWRHYLVLAVIFGVHFVLFFMYRYSPRVNSLILLSVCVWYIIFGMVHHYLKKDLHGSIVLEYVLLASLAFVMLESFL